MLRSPHSCPSTKARKDAVALLACYIRARNDVPFHVSPSHNLTLGFGRGQGLKSTRAGTRTDVVNVGPQHAGDNSLRVDK